MSNTVLKTEETHPILKSLGEIAEAGMVLGRRIISLDVSNEIFGDNTLPEKLKGRDRYIKLLTIHTVAMAALTAFLIFGGAGHGGLHLGGAAYFLISIVALRIIFNIKEIAIESIARSKEKELYANEETEETRCSLQEIIDDHAAAFRAIMDRYHETMREITNTLFVTKTEASTNAVELEEQSSD